MSETASSAPSSMLPVTLVQRWLSPIRRFLEIEASSGVVLLVCTIVALILANSRWAEEFASFWKTTVLFTIGSFTLKGDIGHLIINDGLMTLFFFVVGLEVKREIIMGELRDPRKALLPVIAAFGGVVVPATIYYLLQWGQAGQRGWAIPMATDIAFVIGILALFGRRVPIGLKIFLLTLAIVDDIIAVLVIAVVFTQSLSWSWLGLASIGFLLTLILNRIGVRRVGVYVVIGLFIWVAFIKSGVHPTVAGVLLGLLTPASAWVGQKTLVEVLETMWNRIRSQNETPELDDQESEQLQYATRESLSPLHRLETALHPWVAFGIMPLFALANAGVALDVSKLSDSVAIAVAAGLSIGKPVGILLFCYLSIRWGWTQLPHRVSWGMLTGASCLAGIGFTMALFMNALAFPEAEFPLQAGAGKIGTFAGSAISVIIGAIILFLTLGKRKMPAEQTI